MMGAIRGDTVAEYERFDRADGPLDRMKFISLLLFNRLQADGPAINPALWQTVVGGGSGNLLGWCMRGKRSERGAPRRWHCWSEGGERARLSQLKDRLRGVGRRRQAT
jgi:hypothetical protein